MAADAGEHVVGDQRVGVAARDLDTAETRALAADVQAIALEVDALRLARAAPQHDAAPPRALDAESAQRDEARALEGDGVAALAAVAGTAEQHRTDRRRRDRPRW